MGELMLPSQVADLVEAEALDENRPPDVARYYALLAALDHVYSALSSPTGEVSDARRTEPAPPVVKSPP